MAGPAIRNPPPSSKIFSTLHPNSKTFCRARKWASMGRWLMAGPAIRIPPPSSPPQKLFQPTPQLKNFSSRQGSGLHPHSPQPYPQPYSNTGMPSNAAYNPTEPSESTKMPIFGKTCGISLFAKSRSPQQDREASHGIASLGRSAGRRRRPF